MYFGANYLGGYVSHKQKLSSFVENPDVFGGVLSLICWQELGYDVQNDPTHLDDQVVRDDTKSLNTSGDDIPQVLLWQQNPHHPRNNPHRIRRKSLRLELKLNQIGKGNQVTINKMESLRKSESPGCRRKIG